MRPQVRLFAGMLIGSALGDTMLAVSSFTVRGPERTQTQLVPSWPTSSACAWPSLLESNDSKGKTFLSMPGQLPLSIEAYQRIKVGLGS